MTEEIEKLREEVHEILVRSCSDLDDVDQIENCIDLIQMELEK